MIIMLILIQALTSLHLKDEIDQYLYPSSTSLPFMNFLRADSCDNGKSFTVSMVYVKCNLTYESINYH